MNYRTNKKSHGQTLVEFAFIFPTVILITFSLYEISIAYMEYSISQYAAFMAARSHQVFGNQLDENGAKIYVAVAEDIITNALPFIEHSKIDVHTDGWIRHNAPEELTDDEWRTYRDSFQLEILNTNDVDSDYLSNIESNRHGVLRVRSHRAQSFMFFPNIFSKFEVVMPYRLEMGVRADLDREGENYIFP